MKCKKVRDILLTEYIDDRSGAALKEQIAQHLETCNDCREYYDILKEKVVRPLQEVSYAEAPEEIWEGVRNRIIQKELDKRKLPVFPRKRKLVMALVSVLLLIVLGLGGVRYVQYADEKSVNDYLEQEASFLLALGEGADVDNGNGFGISIEEYFS